MSKSEIQQLIVSGRTKEALKELEQLLPDHQQNTLILLQGRLNSLNNKEGMGIISSSDANIERNRITAAVLSLLEDLPDGGAEEKEKEDAPSGKTILFAAANPTDQARLQTGEEFRAINEEMKKGSKREEYLFLQPQLAVRINDLTRAFKQKPTIIHFSGHGEEEGIVISAGDTNEGLVLNDGTMKLLFKFLKGKTELVLLNSCYAANQAKVISAMGFTVIGHNMPVGDKAATNFSKGFYVGLSEGMSYEEAFNDGRIAVSASHASYVAGIEVWKDGEKLDW
ncbi:MAG: hypothetical protein ACI8YQ_002107 [Polaribacter sp.]|jgi:hypothetical protein